MKPSGQRYRPSGGRKIGWFLVAALFLLTLAACAKEPGAVQPATSNPPTADGRAKERTGNVIIGDKRFAIVFYDNETTRALQDKLPMTLKMTELNGNEKYWKMPQALPVGLTEAPETIQAGELMCWSADTLVLFYAAHPNRYGGYVKLGRIEDAVGLQEAVGGEAVQIRFELAGSDEKRKE